MIPIQCVCGMGINMLRLNYIICGKLPEQEIKYLQKNLKKEEILLLNEENKLKENLILDGNAGMFISGDKGELYRAAERGMATICYLPPAEIWVTDAINFTPDIYVEGFEEVDASFLQRVYERHHHIPWTILETKRCRVREFSMDDLDALFELYSGEGMTEYIEPLYPYEQEKEYQQAYIENMYRFYGYGMWIVCDKETGQLIGRAGVEHREELDGELELGYAIGTPYQRKGYAAEVCSAILDYVKNELESSSVCCLIEKGNHVSRKLAEKLGFVFLEEMQLGEKEMQRYRYTF